MAAHKNMVRMPKQHDSTQEPPYYHTTAALLQWDTTLFQNTQQTFQLLDNSQLVQATRQHKRLLSYTTSQLLDNGHSVQATGQQTKTILLPYHHCSFSETQSFWTCSRMSRQPNRKEKQHWYFVTAALLHINFPLLLHSSNETDALLSGNRLTTPIPPNPPFTCQT